MKVLIVDDSSFVALFCRQALLKAGYEVVGEAFDGEKAVEMATELKPDLIIMDIALPKKNGFEASKEIMQHLPQTKIVAITALDAEWAQEKYKESGCVGFIAKPFDVKDLMGTLMQVTGSDGELMYG